MNETEQIKKLLDKFFQEASKGKECTYADTWRSIYYIPAIDKYSKIIAGYRKVPELEIVNDEIKLIISLVSKYPFEYIRDVIDEACKHQRDFDSKTVKGE